MKNILMVVAVFLSGQSLANAALPPELVGVYRCAVPAGEKVINLRNQGGVPYVDIDFANQDSMEGAAGILRSKARATTTVVFENQILTFAADGSVDSNGFACTKD